VFKLFSAPGALISRRAALMAGAGALIVAGLTVMSSVETRAQAPLKPDVNMDEFMKKGDLPENVLGKADAPYTIVEYSSMTCPHCAHFHTKVLPQIKKEFIDTGKAKYIVREFPLDNVAAAAFMLARCVEPAKYFDFVDLLYSNQPEWAFKDNPLPGLQKFAKQVGFTEERFNQCIKDDKTLKYIEWVRSRAHDQFGVKATPTFFINGKKLDGVDLENFERILDRPAGKS
jgi:protein-disulfide isomerase